MCDDTNTIKFHDVNEMKTNIINLGNLNEEIKSMQERLKTLRTRKTNFTEVIKSFMRINELQTCRLKPDTNSNIDKVMYNERTKKERISVKKVKELLTDFFNDIDDEKFINIPKNERTDVIFEYIESKRDVSKTTTITVKKKNDNAFLV